MRRPFEIALEETAYQRTVLFAVEVLDPVTLSRVSDVLEVKAEGLRHKPIVNASGVFVWLDEDFEALQRITIEPRTLPYRFAEVAKADVTKRKLTTVQLQLRTDYRFDGGVTGLRGALIESRTVPPQRPEPVVKADARLQWLDDDGVTWRDAPVVSETDASGDFVAILRFASSDQPRLDAQGAITVRLHVSRGPGDERHSADLRLQPGRVVEPATLPNGSDLLIFAWDELTP